MRARASSAVESTLLVSGVLHALAVGLLLRLAPESTSLGDHPPPETLEVYSVPEEELLAASPRLPSSVATLPPNTVTSLTPEAVAALPRDPLPLVEPTPSPRAVTDFSGQIVELAPSDQPQPPPEKADYLSVSNLRVEQEQASRRYQVNPEVVAPTLAEKSALSTGVSGEAQALQKGEVGKARGEASGSQVAMLPPSSSQSTRPEQVEAAKPASTQSAVPLPAKPPTPVEPAVHASQQLDPSQETELLSKPVPERLPPAKTVAPAPTRTLVTPLLAKLSAPLQPPLTPTPMPRGLPETAEAVGKSPAPVASLLPAPGAGRSGQNSGSSGGNSGGNGSGEGGGDGGSAEVTFRQGERRGAPSNDRLQEKKGDSTLLNAREFKYYGYMQLIRRQVNFYWSQALDNISGVEEPLKRSEYTTVVNLTLDAKGNLKELSMVRTCGVKRFDEATLLAFRAAAPFPPPPDGLVGANGEANMPEFSFTVTLGQPAPRYSGIDPRAHVLFPGIARP